MAPWWSMLQALVPPQQHRWSNLRRRLPFSCSCSQPCPPVRQTQQAVRGDGRPPGCVSWGQGRAGGCDLLVTLFVLFAHGDGPSTTTPGLGVWLDDLWPHLHSIHVSRGWVKAPRERLGAAAHPLWFRHPGVGGHSPSLGPREVGALLPMARHPPGSCRDWAPGCSLARGREGPGLQDQPCHASCSPPWTSPGSPEHTSVRPWMWNRVGPPLPSWAREHGRKGNGPGGQACGEGRGSGGS